MIANGIILSKLIYLIPLWAGADKYLLNSLQLIQNKAARLVTKCGQETPIRMLLRQCGWLSVAQMGMYHSLVSTFKIKQSKCPLYLYSKLWDTEDVPYNVRSAAKHRIRLGRSSQAVTQLARCSFKYRSAEDWNTLPVVIRQTEDLSSFKCMLRKWIFENINI